MTRSARAHAIDSTISYLGVIRAHSHSLGYLVQVKADASLMVADTYLLINDDINFHTLLGLAF